MFYLSLVVIILLVFIAFMHLYWVFGGRLGLDSVIPTVHDRPLLNPGKIAAFIVAIAMCGFSFIAYLLQFHDLSSASYSIYILSIGWMLSFIFVLRAIGEFNVVGFFKKVKDSKFAKYDTMLYSPLSLFIGLYFVLITYIRSV